MFDGSIFTMETSVEWQLLGLYIITTLRLRIDIR